MPMTRRKPTRTPAPKRKGRARGKANAAPATTIRKLAKLVKDAAARSRAIADALGSGNFEEAEAIARAGFAGADAFARAGITTQTRVRTGNEQLDRALDVARARGQVRIAEILNGPEMLTAAAFGDLLGISPMTVHDWRQAHKVLGLQGAKRGFRFPEWQVGQDGKLFAELPALFERFGDEWAVYRFLVQHHPELDGLTGIEALRGGQSEKVTETAETVARAAFA